MTFIYHFYYSNGILSATFKTKEGAFAFIPGSKWEEDQATGSTFRTWKCTNFPHNFYIEEDELLD